MTLHVSNTLTGEREVFEPQDPEEVLLYVCGLTTSDPAHLGHARLWVGADVMHRWLEHEGYDVRHVENFTDVNEKIVARAGDPELGADEPEVARQYIAQMLEEMRALNLKRAEVYPRVSEHVPEIVDLVETLVEKGYAYASNGSVYFDVTSYEGYGKLSNQDVAEIEEQGDPDELAEKRHPADFALWKAGGVDSEAVHEHRKPDHPGDDDGPPSGQVWESPWGEGRPGWHIECSAMSMTHLDETLDVHVGGQDLVFPHHENEIAQSEAATGEQFANYWLHVRLLQTNDEKMSSSLGNFWTVGDALEAVGGNVLRTFLVSTAYHNEAVYSEETLAEAEERWERLERGYETTVHACDSEAARTKVTDDDFRAAVATAREDFAAGMNDDFNTREAVTALMDLTAAVNRHVDGREQYDYDALRDAVHAYEELGEDVLGLSFDATPDGEAELAGDVVDLVLSVRERERDAGNYERADELRDELEALGVEVQDTDDGPTYRL
jgi:cysteinyl-tRNA synthetase